MNERLSLWACRQAHEGCGTRTGNLGSVTGPQTRSDANCRVQTTLQQSNWITQDAIDYRLKNIDNTLQEAFTLSNLHIIHRTLNLLDY